MAIPVITTTAGGLPVVDVTATSPKLGLPVTEASNGRGIAVTKVAANGLPVTYSTVADYPPGTGAEATAFLARTSGLDATHTSAYAALIDGLVADGVWPKFDVLHIYATQNTATAQLNLVSSSYPATLGGSITFTADRGYTGDDGGQATFINTGFNPATAPSPKYVQNSAHLSAWSLTSTPPSSGNPIMGYRGASINTLIYPVTGGNVAYFIINNAYGANVANANSLGHYIATRSAFNSVLGYRNGASFYTGSEASGAVQNINIFVLSDFNSNSGGHVESSALQTAMASIGSSLTAIDVTNFYNRLRTYMTAVGVP